MRTEQELPAPGACPTQHKGQGGHHRGQGWSKQGSGVSVSLGHCSAHSCWEAGPAWHTEGGDQQVNGDCLAGHQGRGDLLRLMAERTCLPTAARLEAVDLLRGPLRPAAPNPGANMSPSKPTLPMGEEAGMQSRALRHSHASPPAWVYAGPGTPLSASLVPAATLPHQHRSRNLSSRLLIQPPL